MLATGSHLELSTAGACGEIKQISKELPFKHPRAGETVPMPGDVHTGAGGIHSGKGYPRQGGHYNNWWWDEISKRGGP
jgi:hypothetical protein